jgi:hypothetical protein
VSVGKEHHESLLIFGVQEIVPGEIWSVTFSSKGVQHTLYVLEETCEVIGAFCYSAYTSPTSGDVPLARVDWSSYIASNIASISKGEPTPPLFSRVGWSNHEEYNHGISKHWLGRMKGEGERGREKVRLAERYILACVIGNRCSVFPDYLLKRDVKLFVSSVSGKWMSSTEMAQEFNGLPTRCGGKPVKKASQTVHMFVPECVCFPKTWTPVLRSVFHLCRHHHVEGVHLTASGHPLHPDVAVVQTPVREYFILKRNGMQIGTEEDGVAPIWQELLKCKKNGIAWD